MLIPSSMGGRSQILTSLSRRVNANSQQVTVTDNGEGKLIKKGEC